MHEPYLTYVAAQIDKMHVMSVRHSRTAPALLLFPFGIYLSPKKRAYCPNSSRLLGIDLRRLTEF